MPANGVPAGSGATRDRRVGEARRAGEPVRRRDVGADREAATADAAPCARHPERSRPPARRSPRPRRARSAPAAAVVDGLETAAQIEHQIGHDDAHEAARRTGRRIRTGGSPPGRPAHARARPSVTTGLNGARDRLRTRGSARQVRRRCQLFSSRLRGRRRRASGVAAAMPDPTTAATQERGAERLSGRPPRRAQRGLTLRGPPIAGPADGAAQRPRARDPVVDPHAPLARGRAGPAVKHLEVVTDGRLGEVERVVEVAHARLAVRVRRRRSDSTRRRTGSAECLQRAGAIRSASLGAERQHGQDRWAAGDRLDGGQLEQGLRHASILT